MRDLSGVPAGSTLLWKNPEDRSYVRWGIVALVAATATAAGTAGFFIGHRFANRRKR